MIKEYKHIVGLNPIEIEPKVQKALEDGWDLHGDGFEYQYKFYQSVTRTRKPKVKANKRPIKKFHQEAE